MYDVLANGEFVEYATAMHWSYTEETLAMLHYVEGDVDAFRDATRDVSLLEDLTIMPAGEGACYAFVTCETTPPMRQLYGPIQGMTAMPVPPIVYHPDGTLTINIVGPPAELKSVLDGVPDPMNVTVEEVGGIETLPGMAETRLSPRQREALDAAIELGYYVIPREATHEDVAAAIDCAPSTAAEHLRKAESAVLRSVFATESTPTASPRS